MILAIDPGTTQSAYCWYEKGGVGSAGILDNSSIILLIKNETWPQVEIAIEMVASYGMAVGKEVFETVRWIGRFQQA